MEKLERGRNVDGVEENSDYEIWSILRRSFDDLEVEERDIFLDICYFFGNDVCPKGMSKERALRLWVDRKKNKMEKDMKVVLYTLINQSLVEIDENRMIRVHDQLQDMGRNFDKVEKNTRI